MRPVTIAFAPRVAALALVLAFAVPAVAAPLTARDLVSLAQGGLSEPAIARLVEAQGLASSLTADDALALRAAGLSPELVSRLVLMGAPSGIQVEQRDGVTVVTGEGLPAGDETRTPPEEPAAPEPSTTVVAGEAPLPPEAVNPYPEGAIFGLGEGVIFLPARFGGSEPSPFGRTIVTEGALSPGCAPVIPSCAPAAVVETTRHVRIRTSRGDLWLPN